MNVSTRMVVDRSQPDWGWDGDRIGCPWRRAVVAGDAGRKDAAGAATGYPFHPPESGRCEGHGWCRVSDGFHLLTWISGGEVRGGVGLEIDEEAGGGALDFVEKLEVLGDGVSGFVEIVDFEFEVADSAFDPPYPVSAFPGS